MLTRDTGGMSKPKTHHGGTRPNAGRKPAETPRKRVTVALSEPARQTLADTKKRTGESFTAIMERLLEREENGEGRYTMNDTGECTIEERDCLFYDSPMYAAASKGMPVDGVFSPKLKPGIIYTTTRFPDGSIHIRWEPKRKGRESS